MPPAPSSPHPNRQTPAGGPASQRATPLPSLCSSRSANVSRAYCYQPELVRRPQNSRQDGGPCCHPENCVILLATSEFTELCSMSLYSHFID